MGFLMNSFSQQVRTDTSAQSVIQGPQKIWWFLIIYNPRGGPFNPMGLNNAFFPYSSRYQRKRGPNYCFFLAGWIFGGWFAPVC